MDEGTISGSSNETKPGIIDRTGKWIEPPVINIFDPDERSIRIVLVNALWGLQRSDRSWLVKPQFNAVDALSGGLARVRVSGKIGFVDRSGRFVIDPVFDEAWAFKPGLENTPVRQGGHAGVIDRTGAWTFRIPASGLYRAVASDRNGGTQFGWHFQQGRRWGLLDLEGRILLKAGFDQPVQRCSDGHLVASEDGQRLYFKSDGGPLEPQEGRILDASCGSRAPYIVKAGDKFGLVDGDGKEIIPPALDALITVTKDIWNAKRDGKWGRLGSDGRWLFEPKFDYLSHSDSIIVAATEAKRGFLNADGSWLIEPRFDAARPRDSGTAFVTVDGSTGIIRVNDQSWTVAPRPGVMCDIPYGILSQREGHRSILSPSGEPWIDAHVDRLGIDLETGLLPFLADGKWGLMDTAGKVAIQPTYDAQVSFRPSLRGIAWAKHDGRWCPIDRRGHDVPGLACTERPPLGEGGGYFRCVVEP
ncbi:WG repeat-containing protein [Bradyrhizobium sp. CCBAU 51753]|uniref:WG repeat-containing protein n=1 Tax=Bradyrhizobium sp. CCBAU 51753 TaxID=1325100 RepID=UPI001FEDC8B9|nr:WG repeat-containing protein [Bradyrhizobium sp. CCBAU 51753]